MPDRDREAQSERNRRTLLVVRLPNDGLKAQVEEAAELADMTVSAFVAAAVRKELAARQAGTAEQEEAPEQ